MWKLLKNAWGYIVGRGRKKPHPVPVPAPIPAPAPPVSTDFETLRQQEYSQRYANFPGVVVDYATEPTTHNVELYMPATAGRGDLSKPMPDWMALASILGPNSNAMKQTLLNAAAHSLFPFHFDDATGSPHNIDNDPFVKLDGRDGFAGRILTDTTAASFPGVVDDAHHPQLAYLPFLAATTPAEQERWLRVIQYQAQWPMLRYGTSNGLGSIQQSAEQVRGIAHCLMNIALAAVATRRWEAMGLTPSRPLLSAEYLYRKVENNLRWLEEVTVKSRDPLTQAFRIYPPFRFWDVEQYALWMAEMVTITLGVMARMGFTRAKVIADWAMEGIKSRLRSGSGWAGPSTTAYKVDFVRDGKFALTWGELHANAVAPDAPYYDTLTHGALCLAASMGDTEAADMAAKLRATGFGYVSIGNFFDPTPRPIAMTQPTASADPQYQPFIVTDNPPDGMDYGREYIATAPGQVAKTSPYLTAAMALIMHTGPNYTYVFYNGPARTNYDFIQFADRKYDVKNRAWL